MHNYNWQMFGPNSSKPIHFVYFGSLNGVVPALYDDSSEFSECPSIQFDPVNFVLLVSAPSSSIHVVLISRRLPDKSQHRAEDVVDCSKGV